MPTSDLADRVHTEFLHLLEDAVVEAVSCPTCIVCASVYRPTIEWGLARRRRYRAIAEYLIEEEADVARAVVDGCFTDHILDPDRVIRRIGDHKRHGHCIDPNIARKLMAHAAIAQGAIRMDSQLNLEERLEDILLRIVDRGVEQWETNPDREVPIDMTVHALVGLRELRAEQTEGDGLSVGEIVRGVLQTAISAIAVVADQATAQAVLTDLQRNPGIQKLLAIETTGVIGQFPSSGSRIG